MALQLFRLFYLNKMLLKLNMSTISTIPNIDRALILGIFTTQPNPNKERDTATAPLASEASETMDSLDVRRSPRLPSPINSAVSRRQNKKGGPKLHLLPKSLR